jgi:DNA invertase Pin-like site-specific DNA recombinase
MKKNISEDNGTVISIVNKIAGDIEKELPKLCRTNIVRMMYRPFPSYIIRGYKNAVQHGCILWLLFSLIGVLGVCGVGEVEFVSIAGIGVGTQARIGEFAQDTEKEQHNEDERDEIERRSKKKPDSKGKIKCALYTRVSSPKQAQEGKSIEVQEKTLRKVAEERDAEIVKVIRDKGETGMEFNRSFHEVIELARLNEIDEVLVTKVNRIGRDTIGTLRRIGVLQNEFGVRVVTQDGELDIDDMKDLMNTMLKSLTAEISNINKGRSSLGSTIRNFKEKDWNSVYKGYEPLGYVLKNGWLKIDEEKRDIVRDIFETFAEADKHRPYRETIEIIEGKYDVKLDRHALKKDLRRRVYIGKPTFSTPKVREREGGPVVIEDSSLQIVCEELFEKVQEKIESLEKSNSKEEENVIEKVGTEHGHLELYQIRDIHKVICPRCQKTRDDIVIMNRNGQVNLEGNRTNPQKFICPECGKQTRLPRQKDLKRLRGEA